MRDWKILLIIPLIMILLAGCTSARADAPGQAVVTLTLLPSDTSTSLPTATETVTPTLEPTATDTPEPSPTPTAAPVTLIGAGDIAVCGEANIGDENTAEILKRFPDATIFTAGDNVYGDGTEAEFRSCFTPSWGQFKDRIRPAPGNHDYHTDNAAPYYAYFGTQAGEPGQGFYSYDLGDWHIVALNSNCDAVGCRNDSQQAAWLREDLQKHDKRCQLIYWHHPLFTSGPSGNYGSARSFWQIAHEFGVEVVVNGHEHSYERFAPQDPGGNATPDGIRQFVVGTGGVKLRWWEEIQPNSEVRDNQTHGVIKFTLYTDRYDWEFIPVNGSTFTDTGSEMCH